MKSVPAVGLLLLLSVACHKNKDAEGPMQRAGKGVDHAAEKTGDALHTAADKTGEAATKAAHATGDAFQKAGQKLKGNDSPPPAPAAPKDSQ